MTVLLQVEDLQVAFATRHGVGQALHGIDLTLDAGETLGIVGESGSGKSVTALRRSCACWTAPGASPAGGCCFDGRDITRAGQRRPAPPARLRDVDDLPEPARRAEPDPHRRASRSSTCCARTGEISGAEARAQALDLLRAVLIRDPERRLDAYPHELSGGMCQRVMIAMAIACEPALLIADEPTTGLDVTTQQTVMELLARINAERGMAMILITHDLGLAARYCDRIAVMERGAWSSSGPTGALFRGAAPRLYAPPGRGLAHAALHARRPRAGGGAAGRRPRRGRMARAAGRCWSCSDVVKPSTARARGGRRLVPSRAGRQPGPGGRERAPARARSRA